MQLFADRFAIDGDGRAVDLATGRRSELRRVEGIGADRVAQVRWSVRCDRWLTLNHHAVARLLDYGLAGRCDRFEAWDCGAAWEGSADEAERIRALAGRFFSAVGVTWTAPGAVHGSRGCAVVVPGAEDGYECPPDPDAAESAPVAVRGLTRIPRSALAALAEMFDSVSDRRLSVASLWGAAQSGKQSVVLDLARAARLKGFVPVASELLGKRYAPLLQGRTLFVIHDECERSASAVWPQLLHATLQTPLGHALLLVGEREPSIVNGVALQTVTADDLVASVCPAPFGSRVEGRVRRAAQESRGRPGMFAETLWPGRASGRRASRKQIVRAAERAAAYGEVDDLAPGPASGVDAMPTLVHDTWPSPGELAALRSHVAIAGTHLAQGRHAPAIRQLRKASSALARRDAWADAAAATVLVARALLGRGRAREAVAALDDARGYAEHSGDDATLLDIAVLSGEARTDLLRLDEAETILAAAVTTALHTRNDAPIAAASTALARCLFWRGEYVDAAAALDRDIGGVPVAVQVRRRLLRARIDVGRGDVSAAMAAVSELKADTAIDDTGLRAAVSCTAGFVHLSVGDLEAALQDARDCMAAARAARDPLRSVRGRLVAIEAERRRGRFPAASAQLDRLRRVRRTLPPLLRVRFDVVSKLVAAGGDFDAAAVGRHVREAGVPALSLYASAGSRRAGIDPAVDDLLVILRACQTAEDEAVVLKDVCAHVRRQLQAIGAAFVARGHLAACETVVGDGSHIESGVSERAIAAAIVIRPHRRGDRVEGAAPVLYGGGPIGAFAARWSIGSTFDAERAAAVLATAATAAAPMLAAALAHRARAAQPEGTAVAPLLGITPAMAELRASARRAGAAPFGVLIVGESGSGKELVARAIHRSSTRREASFCTINCAALPDDLVESELFGHARGAFTGAIADRPGVFEEAHGGTLFLDEIGELSLRAQAKILRVIQEGELRRVGENVPRRIDVRLIAATNRDLGREVDAGRFRLDLLYRLDVIRIVVPSLRDRLEDIAVLAAQFWKDATARIDSRATLAPATLAALARYGWPGNVRELQNVLAALAVRSPRRGLVPPTALPPHFQTQAHSDDSSRLDQARRTFEERFVRAALVRTGGHRTRAAAELGVSRQGLTKLLARLGIADAP